MNKNEVYTVKNANSNWYMKLSEEDKKLNENVPHHVKIMHDEDCYSNGHKLLSSSILVNSVADALSTERSKYSRQNLSKVSSIGDYEKYFNHELEKKKPYYYEPGNIRDLSLCKCSGDKSESVKLEKTKECDNEGLYTRYFGLLVKAYDHMNAAKANGKSKNTYSGKSGRCKEKTELTTESAQSRAHNSDYLDVKPKVDSNIHEQPNLQMLEKKELKAQNTNDILHPFLISKSLPKKKYFEIEEIDEEVLESPDIDKATSPSDIYCMESESECCNPIDPTTQLPKIEVGTPKLDKLHNILSKQKLSPLNPKPLEKCPESGNKSQKRHNHLVVSSEETDVLFPPYVLMTERQNKEEEFQESDHSWKYPKTSLMRAFIENLEQEGNPRGAQLDRIQDPGLQRHDLLVLIKGSFDKTFLETYSKNSIYGVAETKGYDVIREIDRGRNKDRGNFAQLLLCNNKNNYEYPLVELTVYNQGNVNMAASMVAPKKSPRDRHYQHKPLIRLPPHENLARLLHRFRSSKFTVQVTEHLQWITLTDLLRSGSPGPELVKGLDTESCKIIFKQICKGLSHLHQHNMLHGDLTCNNILVTNDLQVKLTGYGPSCQRILEPAGKRSNAYIIDPYAPPEIRSKRETWSKGSDVWCLGIALLHMSIGRVSIELITMIRKALKSKGRIYFQFMDYQMCLLIDSILQSRTVQRPSIKLISEHTWLSDFRDLTTEIEAQTAKNTLLRTDGETFPLPKRVQQSENPGPESYYAETDSEYYSSEEDEYDDGNSNPLSIASQSESSVHSNDSSMSLYPVNSSTFCPETFDQEFPECVLLGENSETTDNLMNSCRHEPIENGLAEGTVSGSSSIADRSETKCSYSYTDTGDRERSSLGSDHTQHSEHIDLSNNKSNLNIDTQAGRFRTLRKKSPLEPQKIPGKSQTEYEIVPSKAVNSFDSNVYSSASMSDCSQTAPELDDSPLTVTKKILHTSLPSERRSKKLRLGNSERSVTKPCFNEFATVSGLLNQNKSQKMITLSLPKPNRALSISLDPFITVRDILHYVNDPSQPINPSFRGAPVSGLNKKPHLIAKQPTPLHVAAPMTHKNVQYHTRRPETIHCVECGVSCDSLACDVSTPSLECGDNMMCFSQDKDFLPVREMERQIMSRYPSNKYTRYVKKNIPSFAGRS